MRAFVLAICLLAATGCDESSPTAPAIPLNERFTLAPGEVAAVRDTSLRLQFVDVTGDSRCPADAICIQGGDAVVHVRAADGSERADYDLHTGDASRAMVVHRQLRIELVDVQPYPFSSRPIQPGEYRATFMVTRP